MKCEHVVPAWGANASPGRFVRCGRRLAFAGAKTLAEDVFVCRLGHITIKEVRL